MALRGRMQGSQSARGVAQTRFIVARQGTPIPKRLFKKPLGGAQVFRFLGFTLFICTREPTTSRDLGNGFLQVCLGDGKVLWSLLTHPAIDRLDQPDGFSSTTRGLSRALPKFGQYQGRILSCYARNSSYAGDPTRSDPGAIAREIGTHRLRRWGAIGEDDIHI